MLHWPELCHTTTQTGKEISKYLAILGSVEEAERQMRVRKLEMGLA